jgi:hypothetical protein
MKIIVVLKEMKLKSQWGQLITGKESKIIFYNKKMLKFIIIHSYGCAFQGLQQMRLV